MSLKAPRGLVLYISYSKNSGELIALQKPGKPKGPPKNLRPITVLNTIRKALSIITLHRIRLCTEEYLSHSQSGFRPDRSTADLAWAHSGWQPRLKKKMLRSKSQGLTCHQLLTQSTDKPCSTY